MTVEASGVLLDVSRRKAPRLGDLFVGLRMKRRLALTVQLREW
jgi:hypothetical protein